MFSSMCYFAIYFHFGAYLNVRPSLFLSLICHSGKYENSLLNSIKFAAPLCAMSISIEARPVS